MKSNKFKGDFAENSQGSSIPPVLLSFVSCVMDGSLAKSYENKYCKQAMLSVSQLMNFNTFTQSRKDTLLSYH